LKESSLNLIQFVGLRPLLQQANENTMIRLSRHYNLHCNQKRLHLWKRSHFVRTQHFALFTQSSSSSSSSTVSYVSLSKFNIAQNRKSAALVIAATTLFLACYQTRQWRVAQIESLPLAPTSAAFAQAYPERTNWQELVHVVERNGLMGFNRSTKEDLDGIRKWHAQHNYKGGLVVRDLSRPLFKSIQAVVADVLQDPVRLARRECYFLYYELQPDGHLQQEVFCRGTTIAHDILTCLDLRMVRDDELGARVHYGFLQQANRILEDLEPLLSSTERATVRVHGHSLGAAVAMIVAAKLTCRGFTVVQVTGIGLPRFCARRQDAVQLLTKLPDDTLRIENEFDFVTFLPPFGITCGNKIWITNGQVRFVDTIENKWADSVWVNFLAWELLKSGSWPHRIFTYANHLKDAFQDATNSTDVSVPVDVPVDLKISE
jgi:hypothetical protein